MGISCLVSTGKHEVLDRFAFEIANIWLDVLGEIKEQESQEDNRYVFKISHTPSIHEDFDLIPFAYNTAV